MLSAEQARGIAIEDLRYLTALARCAALGAADEALALRLPRAADAPGMRDHHTENCRKAGLDVPSPSGPLE